MEVSKGGAEHLFIRDRIKDMIKVKVTIRYPPFSRSSFSYFLNDSVKC
jgi:hypothetical protein